MDRIKYYSTNDIMCGYNLENIEDVIIKCKSYEEICEIQDINNLLELYNVKKYLDNEIYLSYWTKNDIKKYKEDTNYCFSIVAKFFKSTNIDSFIKLYKKVQRIYKTDFWELVEKFGVYKNINKNKFKKFINESEIELYELLKHKKIVNYFSEIIKNYMINNYCFSAEILLDKYERKNIIPKNDLFIPKQLSNKDKKTIISKYIDSMNPNLNYLQLIMKIQSNKNKIEISPKILLKAKKKIEILEKELFNDDSGFFIEAKIIFSKTQEEIIIKERKNFSTTIKYSTKWIENNLDYATLLNNFIYLFNFVDLNMRCTFVNKFSDISALEESLGMSSKNDYLKGMVFAEKDLLSLTQLRSYYSELSSLNIKLEDIIEWFFKDYISDEFDVNNFEINMPSNNSTILEKCTNIMPALEYVLKQFSLFVREGEINIELLQISSEHLIYENIPSLLDRKYVYGIGNKYNTVTSLLFSDQISLRYSEKNDKSYQNHFELLCNEKMKLEDYPNYFITKINWLINNSYLCTNKDGYITFSNKILISILKDLYFNEVINYWRVPKSFREIIDKLEKENIIEFESSLFTRPEQAYINYFLNKSQFNNGLDLRNKYIHTQPNINDKEKHNQNYMRFLRLFILTVIKINDDFQILENMKKINN